jgi:hypothetical protein
MSRPKPTDTKAATKYAQKFWKGRRRRFVPGEKVRPRLVLSQSELVNQEYWFVRQSREEVELGAELFNLEGLLDPKNPTIHCAALDKIVDTLERGALPRGILLQAAIAALKRHRITVTKRRGRKLAATFTRNRHVIWLLSELEEKFGIKPTRNRDLKEPVFCGCSILADLREKGPRLSERSLEQIWQNRNQK